MKFSGPIAALLVALVAGCAPPVVVRPMDPIGALRDERSRALERRTLSESARRTLRELGLSGAAARDPEQAVRRLLDGEQAGADLDACRLLVAELSLLEARERERAGRDEAAARWYLIATLAAHDRLLSRETSAGDGRTGRYLETLYGHALGRYVALRSRHGTAVLARHRFPLAGARITVELEECDSCWRRDDFEILAPADELALVGLKRRHRQEGLGAALTGFRRNDGSRPLDRFYPPEGFVQPVSARIAWDAPGPDGARRARLRFHDPRRTPAAPFGGRDVPLAADFSAPYGLLVSRSSLKKIGFQGLRDADRYVERRGIYLLEPYDPDKIPVLMIHGMASSPITWIALTNAMNGDPEIRARFQVWHYFYPTGVPWLESARVLRYELEEIQTWLDPERDDRATHDMVVIGHSMGGLLAKTLVTDSGDDLWSAMFVGEPEQLELTEPSRHAVVDALHFKPRPFVTRAIFVSVPHRGSRRVSSPLGRLGAGLTRVPSYFAMRMREVFRNNEALVREEMRRLHARGKFNAIRGLAPDDPFIRAFAEVPVDPSVPYHTIVGDRGRGDGAQGGDGLVPYTSAHLEGAASELIVPTGHNAHASPFAIHEILRILRDHGMLSDERRDR